MGIPLLTGRDFTRDHGAGAEKVTLISKPLANRLFPNGGAAQAIGKRLTLAPGGRKEAAGMPPQELTIIGVTADFPTSQMSTDRAQLLLPLAQQLDFRRYALPVDADDGGMPAVLLIARAGGGEQPQKIFAAVENVVRELNPEFRRERIVTGTFLRKNSMNDFLKASASAGGRQCDADAFGAGNYGLVGLMVAARTRSAVWKRSPTRWAPRLRSASRRLPAWFRHAEPPRCCRWWPCVRNRASLGDRSTLGA
jgi:hypothetical protein